MIWVIGDIHGMLDPLKRLLTAIHLNETKDDPVEKIIFIGDYVDHGPSSKEVIDLILSLKYKKVLLAGNHEDMALRFINQDPKFKKKLGNQWFPNGGVDTYESIFSRTNRSMALGLDGCRYNFRVDFHNGSTSADYKGLELPVKYEKFFKRLKYSHREIFDYGTKKISFSFFHGLPRTDQPLSQQWVKSYKAFTTYTYRKGQYESFYDAKSLFDEPEEHSLHSSLGIDHTFLWGRDYSFRWGYGPDIIIHGHTPTNIYPYYYSSKDGKVYDKFSNQFNNFHPDLCLPFIFARDSEAGYTYDNIADEDLIRLQEKTKLFNSYDGSKSILHMDYGLMQTLNNSRSFKYDCGPNGRAEAINIDTGAVNGLALTALGLSKEGVSKGRFELLTALTSASQRSIKMPLRRSITVSKLGSGTYERLAAGLKWATPNKFDPSENIPDDDGF